jgi:polyphosphate glucokinase
MGVSTLSRKGRGNEQPEDPGPAILSDRGTGTVAAASSFKLPPVTKHAGEIWTLAVDIGGTGIKASVLDERGALLAPKARVDTPVGQPPRQLLRTLGRLAVTLPRFDRVSVGFPGAVADGRILTAANLYHRGWIGFELGKALEELCRRPVRVANDVALQGLAAISGKGYELVITLGTGVGSALYLNGLLVPQFSLSRYEARPHTTYDALLNALALKERGAKKWNKRLKEAIGTLRSTVHYERLYIGGGNAKLIRFNPGADVTIISNEAGIRGGIVLWRPRAESGDGATPHGRSVSRRGHQTKTSRRLE